MNYKPQKPSVLDGGIILPNEQMGMDLEAFDSQIISKGAPCIHFRAIKCPLGLTDPSDIRRVSHSDHQGRCHNGFIYVPMGRLTITMTSNQTQLEKMDIGYYDGSTVVASFTRFYDSDPNKRVVVRPFDRIYLSQEDILTGTWDCLKRRFDGQNDRLEFPAIQVENLIDSADVEYHQNVDFDITSNGDIAWRAEKGPDPGTVYSAWYLHRPFYFVDRLLHEIRLFSTHGFLDENSVHLEKLGGSAILVREYVHRTQKPDAEAPAKTQHNQYLGPDEDDLA